MTSVRAFRIGDLPQVAALHRNVFHPRIQPEQTWDEAYRGYFSDVFLNPVFCDGPVTSLVYERDGCIRGFLGVMPRRMRFNGRPVLMAVCSQFVVDPAERGQAGLRLLKHCFAGPQDLTISDEAGDATRRVWEWCGGDSLVPDSLRWMTPFGPAQLVLALLAKRSMPSWLPNAAKRAARLVDAILATGIASGTAAPHLSGSREDLDEPTWLACLRDIAGARALGPVYDAPTLAWAWRRVSAQPRSPATRRMIVRDEHLAAVGWFIYGLGRDGIAEVVQVAARPDALGAVMDHLFQDARQQGAVAVSGRLDRELLPALSKTPTVFSRGSYWTLFQCSSTELRDALHSGNALLTRLEGELCLRFQ